MLKNCFQCKKNIKYYSSKKREDLLNFINRHRLHQESEGAYTKLSTSLLVILSNKPFQINVVVQFPIETQDCVLPLPGIFNKYYKHILNCVF